MQAVRSEQYVMNDRRFDSKLPLTARQDDAAESMSTHADARQHVGRPHAMIALEETV